MTTKEEVEEFCALLKAIVRAYPNMRICQAITNSVTYNDKNLRTDIWNIPNNEALLNMREISKNDQR